MISFLLTPSDTVLFDLVNYLTVTKVSYQKRIKHFTGITTWYILLTKPVLKQAGKSLRIEYNGKPPVAVRPPWKGGFSWKKDNSGNPWVVINCQLEGAKVYFPCKDHPSDEPNEGVDILITVPKGLTVAGPGTFAKSVNKR